MSNLAQIVGRPRLTFYILDAPIAHCEAFWHTAVAAGIIGSVATSFLFLLQVRAVYDKSKSITIFFGVFWLAIPVVGSLVNITGQSTVSLPKSLGRTIL